MNVPSWYELVLLSLAAFRIWKLIGEDTVLDRPRDWLAGKLRNPDGRPFKRGGAMREHYWMTFLLCSWCAGAWIAAVWWGFYEWCPHWTLVVAAPWAISAIVGLIGSKLVD